MTYEGEERRHIHIVPTDEGSRAIIREIARQVLDEATPKILEIVELRYSAGTCSCAAAQWAREGNVQAFHELRNEFNMHIETHAIEDKHKADRKTEQEGRRNVLGRIVLAAVGLLGIERIVSIIRSALQP